MKKIDVAAAPIRKGSGYPSPLDVPCRGRVRHALGNAAGRTQFGVNLQHLPPGAWSSQRHSDIDLRWGPGAGPTHKDGTPY